jgi:hypothetical protein
MTQIPTLPYLVLIGPSTTILLNMKKRQMIFDKETLHVIEPLDPYEGDKYNEPVNEDA